MKELSIEEKAKAYDIALEKIEMFLGSGSSFSREELEYVFPELRESEDERMKEAIIATIHLYYGEPLEDEAKEMIAWLEKQGEKAKYHDICDKCVSEKACNAYCKVCGHYAHTVPTHICRHDCRYYSDFKKAMKL